MMPALNLVFARFNCLSEISTERILHSLKAKIGIHYLQNFIANRLLYPQAMPATLLDFEIDRSILREVLRLQPALLTEGEKNSSKIVIPQEFIERFVGIKPIVLAWINALSPKGIMPIFIKDQSKLQMVGSIYSPEKLTGEKINFFLNDKKYELHIGKVYLFPVNSKITAQIENGETVELRGGEFGIVLNLKEEENGEPK